MYGSDNSTSSGYGQSQNGNGCNIKSVPITQNDVASSATILLTPVARKLFDPKQHSESPQKLNILLLGTTGVGKSTWINAITNYLTYESLDSAINEDIKALIPSKFTMTDENYDQVDVSVGGTDDNEFYSGGQSATQHPTTYTFTAGDMVIRLIDTPGIGDTRGVKQDNINFQNVMNHLTHIDVLHGICILLKPNEARIDILFEFCIKELLTHLHRDSIRNIVFCFTNARGTFYRPGDSFVSLKALLTNQNKIPPLVPLNRETIYCMDNEAFRFLAAIKQGVEFPHEQKNNFELSWATSVNETARLFEHFRNTQPHNTKETVTLNSTRLIIIKLAKPLAEISQNIQTNISVLNDRMDELNNLDIETNNLNLKLKIPQVDLKTEDLPYPTTVCADQQCTEKISIYQTNEAKQIYKTNYRQVCHDHCYLKGVQTDQLDCSELQNCSAMNGGGNGATCTFCGHGWKIHMHITYKTTQVMTETIDKNIESNLGTFAGRREAAQQVINDCNERKEQYEKEQQMITTSAARFAVFLKENSITPYNDAIIKYLDHMISNEESKIHQGGIRTTLEELKNVRMVYEEEVLILERAMKDLTIKAVSIQEVHEMLDQLYSLPLSGKAIKDLITTADQSQKLTYKEKSYIPNFKKFAKKIKNVINANF